MVPKLLSAGKSFKGLLRYLDHDPGAKTKDRVGWTDTLNLAHDDPASAVNEMLWTASAAELLKQQAGIRTGGRRLENPVKHASLNWHPSEQPTREHMMETVRSFLDHMGWGEHQAIIWCHTDKHPHVHVMLNAVHPETGRALDTSFEKRRAQEWAHAYEREQGRIFCEERLLPKEEREPSATREASLKLRAYEKEDDRIERGRLKEPLDHFERGGDDGGNAREWTALKGYQRDERLAFFTEGKEAYRQVRNAAYREVRTEFKNEWMTYYDSKRRGMDKESLAEMKTDIIARQNAELDMRRGAASQELRACRDWDYAQVLRRQQRQRHELHERQQQGLHSYHLIDPPGGREAAPSHYQSMSSRPRGSDERDPHAATAAFRSAANEVGHAKGEAEPARDRRKERQPFKMRVHGPTSMRRPVDSLGTAGLGALGALSGIIERLFDGFFGGGSTAIAPPEARTPNQPPSEPPPITPREAETQQRAGETHAAEVAELQAYWEERGRRRGRERD